MTNFLSPYVSDKTVANLSLKILVTKVIEQVTRAQQNKKVVVITMRIDQHLGYILSSVMHHQKFHTFLYLKIDSPIELATYLDHVSAIIFMSQPNSKWEKVGGHFDDAQRISLPYVQTRPITIVWDAKFKGSQNDRPLYQLIVLIVKMLR